MAVAATDTTAATRLFVQEGAKFEGNTALVGGALYCSGKVMPSSTTSCSLSGTKFISNIATGETEETALFDDTSDGVDGGGAVAVRFANANITDSLFFGNYAQYSGGALLGGIGTDVTIDGGCEFEDNTAVEYGGAIAASSLALGGGTELTNNTATSGGGAVSAIAQHWRSRMFCYYYDAQRVQQLSCNTEHRTQLRGCAGHTDSCYSYSLLNFVRTRYKIFLGSKMGPFHEGKNRILRHFTREQFRHIIFRTPV